MAQQLIVVPLDGSDLSEGALPYATAIARGTDARLELVTVWEPPPAVPTELPALAKDLTERADAYFREYLVKVAKRLQKEGLTIDAEVLIGNVVEEILRLINERGASMLAMATHGRSGLSRLLYGSVASKLVREAPVPTLVVGPKVLEAKAGSVSVQKLLVPLDGSPVAEQALEQAADLATKFGAEIVLARVVQFAALAAPFGVPETFTPQIEQEIVQAASAYLERIKGRLPANVKSEALVLHGFPAGQLLELVEERDIDLVVMTSHTRSGPMRLLLGSVADRMIQGKAPVLLVRPKSHR